MWEAFNGRSAAYQAALEAGDTAALAAAGERNVWRGAPAAAAEELARLTLAQDAHLGGQPLSQLAGGGVHFLPASKALA
jgi:cytochrome b pre-mRNA-processing protein 3